MEIAIGVVAIVVAVLLWIFPPELVRRLFRIKARSQRQQPEVRVLVHRAYFIGNAVEHFMKGGIGEKVMDIVGSIRKPSASDPGATEAK